MAKQIISEDQKRKAIMDQMKMVDPAGTPQSRYQEYQKYYAPKTGVINPIKLVPQAEPTTKKAIMINNMMVSEKQANRIINKKYK